MKIQTARWNWPAFTVAASVLALAWVGFLLYCGCIQLNGMAVRKYTVRGVDVSHYQGDIDWKRLMERDIQYQGQERYIDMNVFCGNQRQWEYWTQKTAEGFNYSPRWGTEPPD